MKKNKNALSQATYLFFVYGVFIMILLGIFFLFTYNHYRKNELENASVDLENTCASVSDSISTQLDNLSTISLNIVYSNAIKENFKEFATYQENTLLNTHNQVASREKANAIHSIITAMIGAYQSASAIKLYTPDGSCVEFGYAMRTTTVDLDSLPWYEEVVNLNGYKYITEPLINTSLPAKGDNQKSQKFVSLVRMFLKSSGEPEGIVEVIQDCDKIFSLLSQLEKQNPAIDFYIYNSRQELVYPYNDQALLPDYTSIPANTDIYEQTAAFIKNSNDDTVLLSHQTLDSYGWNVIVTKPKSAVYMGLNNFRLMFAAIGMGSILVTLVICFFISKRLTLPLQNLSSATKKITLNRVLGKQKIDLSTVDSRIAELAQLCQSIEHMYEELYSTSQDILLSRSEETRAKLQATQSLINPHFLYNCLTTMSIMAEENMNIDITRMCEALCDYFRYISSSHEMIVPLEEEIFYTERYLACMHLRFDEEFNYYIELAPETSRFFIPKLILQPLVENAFKYAFNKTPPWYLSITSAIEETNWILKIEDNGGQLSNHKKNELLSLYKQLDTSEELKSMQIGGMGLKNVYLRLKMLYGNLAIFRIENTHLQKTTFILGGPIYHSKEEFYEQHPQL